MSNFKAFDSYCLLLFYSYFIFEITMDFLTKIINYK